VSVIRQEAGNDWHLYNGDCCEVLKDIPDESIDFGIHSPPFSNLYSYSNSSADMGNCASDAEFFEHYKYAIRELFRTTVKGRLCAVHCKDLPRYANVYGTTGLIDFPGACIQEFESAGWVFHSRITIWKCPVIERERTNNNGLLHKTVKRDTSQVRQGMADYLLLFRKPPADGLLSDKPVERPHGFDRYIGEVPYDSPEHPSKFARTKPASDKSIDIWRRYAEPVWWDISQTNVLNFKLAKDDKDERHICPLQLDLIERAVEIWSSPGDVVLSPFAGIGSEGVGSLRVGRKFVGIELKESYFDHAVRNLKAEEKRDTQPLLIGDES
jgi:DNA modification methylase